MASMMTVAQGFVSSIFTRWPESMSLKSKIRSTPTLISSYSFRDSSQFTKTTKQPWLQKGVHYCAVAREKDPRRTHTRAQTSTGKAPSESTWEPKTTETQATAISHMGSTSVSPQAPMKTQNNFSMRCPSVRPMSKSQTETPINHDPTDQLSALPNPCSPFQTRLQLQSSAAFNIQLHARHIRYITQCLLWVASDSPFSCQTLIVKGPYGVIIGRQKP